MGRNIVIVPNRGTTGSGNEPYISFSGTTGGTISLVVEDDGSLVWDGDNGGLFSIEDNKDGLLHSVNDISGLSILQVYSDDRVILGKWDENALVVDTDQVFMGTDTTSTEPNTKLYVAGTTELEDTLFSGSTQLILKQSYTPTSSGDTSGAIGSLAWDDSYLYIKTNTGWGRSSLDYTF